MTHPAWPLFDLRLRIGNLELRLPTGGESVVAAELSRAVNTFLVAH